MTLRYCGVLNLATVRIQLRFITFARQSYRLNSINNNAVGQNVGNEELTLLPSRVYLRGKCNWSRSSDKKTCTIQGIRYS